MTETIIVKEWDEQHTEQCIKGGPRDCGHCCIINCPYGHESRHRAWLEINGALK